MGTSKGLRITPAQLSMLLSSLPSLPPGVVPATMACNRGIVHTCGSLRSRQMLVCRREVTLFIELLCQASSFYFISLDACKCGQDELRTPRGMSPNECSSSSCAVRAIWGEHDHRRIVCAHWMTFLALAKQISAFKQKAERTTHSYNKLQQVTKSYNKLQQATTTSYHKVIDPFFNSCSK